MLYQQSVFQDACATQTGADLPIELYESDKVKNAGRVAAAIWDLLDAHVDPKTGSGKRGRKAPGMV